MLFVADCGASRVLLARFSGDKSGSFRVEGVSVVPIVGASESDWPKQVISSVLRGIKEFGGAPRIHLVLPGHVCYGKFVKLAKLEASKLTKVIQLEAKQSIPYPLDEVAYGYQTVADDGVDLDIVLAAVKLDVVEPLCRGVEREGSRTITIEPAFITEAAAARALGVASEEGKAGLLLSIGARRWRMSSARASKRWRS
jgi:type IV pilus assembly protein PilM